MHHPEAAEAACLQGKDTATSYGHVAKLAAAH